MQQKSSLSVSALASLLAVFSVGCGGGQLQNNFQGANPSIPGSSASASSISFSVTLLPASASVITGHSVPFTSPFVGSSVVWKVNGVKGGDDINGTIDTAGNYTAPQVAPTEPVKITAQYGDFSTAPVSTTSIVNVLNRAPELEQISPAVVVAGTAAPTVVVTGSGFNRASEIVVVGRALPTLFSDASHLSAQLPTELMQSAGSQGVFVLSPGPGGGSSTQQTLTILPVGKVNTTGNPQVAAYSMTATDGSTVSVDFGPDLNYGLQTSYFPAPQGGGMVRVLVAGMKAFSEYHMRAHVQLADGTVIPDQDHVFTTGGFPSQIVPMVTASHFNRSVESGGVQMLDCINLNGKMSFTVFDRDGTLIWAYDNPADSGSFYFPPKQLPNGNFLINITNAGFREIDLSGAETREMTQDDIQHALVSAGYQLGVVVLHHDIIKLLNGHYVVLGQFWKDVSLSGSSSPTAILGDVLMDFSPDLTVNWFWNSFDHLDVNRHPVSTIDWTHSNAVVLTADGNLLLSMRHQSWILKIDYQNGNGTGDILWKLGYEGDFAVQSSTPADWFYLQHYPNILSEKDGVLRLAIFDNGDNRLLDLQGDTCGMPGQIDCYSRAIVMDVDENKKTATVEYQHTLSAYSSWGGSIQQMDNGNFVAGMSAMGWGSRVEEFTGDAAQIPVWQMDIFGQNAYRSIRLPSLYPGVTWK